MRSDNFNLILFKILISVRNLIMNRLIWFSTKFLSSCFPKMDNSPILSKFSTIRNFRPKTEMKRFLQSSSRNNEMPKTPDLIYMPHITRWIKSKLRFKYLKKIWDPEFSEGAFIYGTTRAVCKITEIIFNGKLDELEGLMTVSAKFKLQDELNFRLSQTQKKLIKLKPEDIKILVPISVNMTKEGNGKMCTVGMRVLALKWHEVSNDNYKLVLVALQTEFSRDYSENVRPEWIITSFSILECTPLAEATATR